MTDAERTVNHFKTFEALEAAMACSLDGSPRDWELTNYDLKTSEVQTFEDEVDRLLTLRSYDILDSEVEPEFEDITKQCKEMFDVPIAVVSIVDKGRQWFKSIQGLDAKETPRSCAFCAHTIQRKDTSGILVVPDATKDDRFKNNPLVLDGLKLRFYAGAPLISPEGPRLGALCIIDTKPRPEGLTIAEQQKLRQLASMTVYNFIERLEDKY